MSFLTKKKAFELLALYSQAEVDGNDEQAIALENQLNDANWRITYVDGRITLLDERVLLSGFGSNITDSNIVIPKSTSTDGYSGTKNTGSKTFIWVIAGIGTILLILGTIALYRRYKNG